MCQDIACKYITLMAIILCVSINDGFCSDRYILSYSGDLYEVVVSEMNIIEKRRLIVSDKVIHIDWPSYNSVDGNIYFDALSIGTYKHGIYKYDNKSGSLSLITGEGSHPAISPNGRLLTYYKHPNKLCVYDVITNKVIRYVDGLTNYNPPVWISDDLIIYSNTNSELTIYDLTSDRRIYTGYNKVVPSASFKDRQMVLAVGYDGRSISMYDVRTNTLSLIYKTKFSSISSSLVLSIDGSGYFYARQTLFSLLRLSELPDLLYRDFSGREISVDGNITFAGGYSCVK